MTTRIDGFAQAPRLPSLVGRPRRLCSSVASAVVGVERALACGVGGVRGSGHGISVATHDAYRRVTPRGSMASGRARVSAFP